MTADSDLTPECHAPIGSDWSGKVTFGDGPRFVTCDHVWDLSKLTTHHWEFAVPVSNGPTCVVRDGINNVRCKTCRGGPKLSTNELNIVAHP